MVRVKVSVNGNFTEKKKLPKKISKILQTGRSVGSERSKFLKFFFENFQLFKRNFKQGVALTTGCVTRLMFIAQFSGNMADLTSNILWYDIIMINIIMIRIHMYKLLRKNGYFLSIFNNKFFSVQNVKLRLLSIPVWFLTGMILVFSRSQLCVGVDSHHRL